MRQDGSLVNISQAQQGLSSPKSNAAQRDVYNVESDAESVVFISASRTPTKRGEKRKNTAAPGPAAKRQARGEYLPEAPPVTRQQQRRLSPSASVLDSGSDLGLDTLYGKAISPVARRKRAKSCHTQDRKSSGNLGLPRDQTIDAIKARLDVLEKNRLLGMDAVGASKISERYELRLMKVEKSITDIQATVSNKNKYIKQQVRDMCKEMESSLREEFAESIKSEVAAVRKSLGKKIRIERKRVTDQIDQAEQFGDQLKTQLEQHLDQQLELTLRERVEDVVDRRVKAELEKRFERELEKLIGGHIESLEKKLGGQVRQEIESLRGRPADTEALSALRATTQDLSQKVRAAERVPHGIELLPQQLADVKKSAMQAMQRLDAIEVKQASLGAEQPQTPSSVAYRLEARVSELREMLERQERTINGLNKEISDVKSQQAVSSFKSILVPAPQAQSMHQPMHQPNWQMMSSPLGRRY
ncbi:hypothetical protein B0H67DRAFT_569378 [Lasiosphaeris hirsuta]|uniref:Uncharacterized protein n=1 Tax=Lasiosphaeris hirsuta TaxID=260670 RepID=A0AA40E5U7_9PEZI|nr:hypothetical protein B0H67DRAFT_569378 [Lasiosphaeris hirsuta]